MSTHLWAKAAGLHRSRSVDEQAASVIDVMIRGGSLDRVGGGDRSTVSPGSSGAATAGGTANFATVEPLKVGLLQLDEDYPASRVVRLHAEDACGHFPTATLEPVSLARLTDNTTAHITTALNAQLLVVDYGNKEQHSTIEYHIAQRQPTTSQRRNTWTLVLYESDHERSGAGGAVDNATRQRYCISNDVPMVLQAGEGGTLPLTEYVQAFLKVSGGGSSGGSNSRHCPKPANTTHGP